MAESKRTCFGFFTGEPENCQRCAAAKKCKALLVSDGFDVAAGVLEEIMETLPTGTYEINMDEIHVDLVPGADPELKQRAREEAGAVYRQLVYGPAAEGASKTKVQTGKIDPSSL